MGKKFKGMYTVVLPDATVKIFLTAAPEARARRRWLEYQQNLFAAALGGTAALINREKIVGTRQRRK